MLVVDLLLEESKQPACDAKRSFNLINDDSDNDVDDDLTTF